MASNRPQWLADENFDNDIVRAVRRAGPDIDIVRVQECGLMGASDPELLAWASFEQRMILTHDVNTFRKYATDRIKRGEPTPGVFLVGRKKPIAEVVEAILMVTHCSEPSEWDRQVLFFPFSKG